MSDLWIIVCVLCCFSLTECQNLSTIPKTTDWTTAVQTCERLSGRLPGVNISNNQLKLRDLGVTKNISSPFWTGVTYDFLDINTTEPLYGYNYPYTCCEKIQNVGGSRQVNCSDCSIYNGFICATSTNETSTNQTNFFPWEKAFLECKRRNLRLPTRNNAQFLTEVIAQVGAFWLDGIRQINFKPDNDNNTPGSEPTYIPSVNTASLSKAGSLQTKTSGAVIGGVVGSVVVVIVITILIVLLVRKNRSRKENNDQREHHVIAHNREIPGLMNSSFGVSRNSSVETGNTKTTNQAETANDFHTQSQKHVIKEQQSTIHDKAVENTYERVASVLYNVAQKDMKPNKGQNCGQQIKGSEDNDEEYDQTSYFSEMNQAASSGNVYDKAIFKHHNNSEYDTIHDRNFKHNENSEYDTTKDINFKHNDNSEYDMTKDINISIDATYDHV